MNFQDLKSVIAFLKAAERLKSVLRSGHTSSGRQESTAEHSWRLCLMAMTLEPAYPQLDFLRLLKICVIHDLGEALNGDIPAPQQIGKPDKSEQERSDFARLAASLPDRLRAELLALWDEYETAATPEARVAKALDKLETILQHIQGRNPPDFDYAFNLDYGQSCTALDSTTMALRRLLDAETARLAAVAQATASDVGSAP